MTDPDPLASPMRPAFTTPEGWEAKQKAADSHLAFPHNLEKRIKTLEYLLVDANRHVLSLNERVDTLDRHVQRLLEAEGSRMTETQLVTAIQDAVRHEVLAFKLSHEARLRDLHDRVGSIESLMAVKTESAAQKASSPQQWRDAKTDPPKAAGLYLMHATDGTVDIMAFTGYFWTFRGVDASILHVPVTHWMELPEPPKV